MDVARKLALQDLQQCANTVCMSGKEYIYIIVYQNNLGKPGSTVG